MMVEVQGEKYLKEPVPDRLMWDTVCHGCINEDKAMAICHAFPKCSDMNRKGEWIKFYIFKKPETK